MDFSILSAKPQPIPLHAYAAMAALFLGALQLSMPKGTAFHRAVGFTWVVLMATVSVSSFFIVPNFKLIGPFSPIHALSVFTLWSLYAALKAAKVGDIARHKRIMILLYLLGLTLTGFFTFWPGRVMHSVLFASL